MREPTPTPYRTPRQTNLLMQQARDNIALRNVQTPLIKGQNPELSSELSTSKFLKGVTP